MDPLSTTASGFALDVGKSIAEKGALTLLKKAGGSIRHLGVKIWRPNGELRVSMSALVRIRRNDGAFPLIRNRHRKENYSAIGGCYKYYSGRGHEELEKFGFLDEDAIHDKDILLDLRGYSKRKHLRALHSWFLGSDSARETARECLTREMREELSEEYKIVPREFPWEQLQFSKSHSSSTFRNFDVGNRIITQYQHFDIYNLEANKHSIDLLERLSSYRGTALIWVTPREIAAGRAATGRLLGGPSELLIRPRIMQPPSMPLVRTSSGRKHGR